MRCKDVRPQLSAYLDDEVTNGNEHEIAQHLVLCQDCQNLRENLVLSRFYLRKLRQEPVAEFHPDMDAIFGGSKPGPSIDVFRKPGLVFLAGLLILLAIAGLFESFNPSTDSNKKPVQEGLSFLPQAKQVDIDSGHPTLVSVSANSWLSVEGKASLVRLKELLKIELTEGTLCVSLDRASGLNAVINVNGFNITSGQTEFSISVMPGEIQVQLLEGRLTVRYGTKKDLRAVKLSSGEAATATTIDEKQSLTVYKLSGSDIANLSRRIDQFEKFSRYKRSNPKQASFQSGDIRIEFWKGE